MKTTLLLLSSLLSLLLLEVEVELVVFHRPDRRAAKKSLSCVSVLRVVVKRRSPAWIVICLPADVDTTAEMDWKAEAAKAAAAVPLPVPDVAVRRNGVPSASPATLRPSTVAPAPNTPVPSDAPSTLTSADGPPATLNPPISPTVPPIGPSTPSVPPSCDVCAAAGFTFDDDDDDDVGTAKPTASIEGDGGNDINGDTDRTGDSGEGGVSSDIGDRRLFNQGYDVRQSPRRWW